jgi:hypothetical protein
LKQKKGGGKPADRPGQVAHSAACQPSKPIRPNPSLPPGTVPRPRLASASLVVLPPPPASASPPPVAAPPPRVHAPPPCSPCARCKHAPCPPRPHLLLLARRPYYRRSSSTSATRSSPTLRVCVFPPHHQPLPGPLLIDQGRPAPRAPPRAFLLVHDLQLGPSHVCSRLAAS